ncbi:MAG: hypothetical protein AAFW95_02520 [Cyanobacteria bacterium J06638_6]
MTSSGITDLSAFPSAYLAELGGDRTLGLFPSYLPQGSWIFW